MKDKKITVAILFGGQSAEHEVSIRSTRAVYANIDKNKYQPLLVYISRDGLWRPVDENTLYNPDPNAFKTPGYSFLPWANPSTPVFPATQIDIYFPMLHGPNGEDGKIQGLLEMAGQPFVGAASVSSALAMDKVAAKILFQNAGLDIAEYFYVETNDAESINTRIKKELLYPVFLKPAFMGSSVGISKVHDQSQLKPALDLAFRYDQKILVEKAINAREIEVSVMGNHDILVSRPGELIPANEFYDYNDKYVDGKTTFYLPAHLDQSQEQNIRFIAEKAYKSLFLNGYSRVDLFIDKLSGHILVNEINTIPGFTEISMFPKLWTLQGISMTDLISRLIDYGFDYFYSHHRDTLLK